MICSGSEDLLNAEARRAMMPGGLFYWAGERQMKRTVFWIVMLAAVVITLYWNYRRFLGGYEQTLPQ